MRLLVTLTTLSLAQLSVSTVPTTTSGPPEECPCPPGWILAGHSCYLMSVEKRTWQDAQKVESCHVMGHGSCVMSSFVGPMEAT